MEEERYAVGATLLITVGWSHWLRYAGLLINSTARLVYRIITLVGCWHVAESTTTVSFLQAHSRRHFI